MALHGALAEAERDGKEVVAGSGDFNASGVLVVDTPFNRIDAVMALVESATAPATLRVSYSVDGSDVTLRAWGAEGAADAEETVSYIIIGKRG